MDAYSDSTPWADSETDSPTTAADSNVDESSVADSGVDESQDSNESAADSPVESDSSSDSVDTAATELPGSGGSGGQVGSFEGVVGSSTFSAFVPTCVEDGEPVAAVFTQAGGSLGAPEMVIQWQSLAASDCFVVVALQAEEDAWNLEGDVANLLDLLDLFDAAYDINRHYLHGYAEGGDWTFAVGFAHSDRFSGLGTFAASFSDAEASGAWPSLLPMPVAIGHGTDDAEVPYSEAEYAYDQLFSAGWDVLLQPFTGGDHNYDARFQPSTWDWWVLYR